MCCDDDVANKHNIYWRLGTFAIVFDVWVSETTDPYVQKKTLTNIYNCSKVGYIANREISYSFTNGIYNEINVDKKNLKYEMLK